jgi:hypothetical protein
MESLAPKPGSETFSPITVHMTDSVGAIFLGLLALALLAALLRAQARLRAATQALSARS